ncbi:uncharacterized protein LOC122084003 isoform X3 [Macadamia integrifolia]|uniref:uncharacterized protein LOC122084003 isoform X3 n=1 Tax=Macadamia integrifolia TaxID=60698 RepID=UPI001C4E311F|nr:uncharacterized protein LOC122084003 isoform X3 [Macadamia integrifolia]
MTWITIRRKRKGESVKILAPRNLTWVSTRRKRKGEPVKILAPRNLTWITIRRKRKGESVKILAPRRKRKGEPVKILAPRYPSNSSCCVICCTFSEPTLCFVVLLLEGTSRCGKASGNSSLFNLDNSTSYLKGAPEEGGGD